MRSKDQNSKPDAMLAAGPVDKGGMRANQRFDLEERTAQFGEQIIEFAKKIPQGPITMSLISQVVSSGMSIGANYCEANDSESKRDFCHKMSLCKKESHEAKHWLRMIAAAAPQLKAEARRLWQESNELNLIFGAIVRKQRASQSS